MTKRGVARNDRVETNHFNDPLNRCPQGRQPDPAVGGRCIALRGGQGTDGAGIQEGERTEVEKRPRRSGAVYAEGLPQEVDVTGVDFAAQRQAADACGGCLV